MEPDVEAVLLECPSCGASPDHLTFQSEPPNVGCSNCGEKGTLAYFTPGPVIDTTPRLITREVHVEDERIARDPLAPVKAMSAAMDLFARAAGEEGLDIIWHTMRIAGARQELTATTTFVAAAMARPRAPHRTGGAASGLVDPKVERPLMFMRP